MTGPEPSLKVHNRELADLYRGDPAVVFFHSAPLRADDLPPWLGDLAIRKLSVAPEQGAWVLRDLSSRTLAARGKDLTQVTSPLSSIWAITALDDDAFAAAGRLRSLFGAATAPDVRRISSPDDPAIAAWLLAICLADRGEFMGRNHGLLSDIAALRENFERMVRIPAEVTAVLHNLHLAGLRQVFSNEHVRPAAPLAEAGWPRGVDLTAEALVQPLPVYARGLAGLDLHVSAAGGEGDGVLLLSLEATDAAEVMACWRVPLKGLRDGWLPLRLKSPSPAMHRALELSARMEGGGACSVSLSTRPASPFPEYALRGRAAPPPQPTMLQVRVWGGLPGTATPDLATSPRFRIPVAKEAVASAAMPWPHADSESFAVLPAGGVRVRGGARHPTGVRLTIPISGETRAVGCQAKLFNVTVDDPMTCRLVAAAAGADFADVSMARGVIGATPWATLRGGDGEQALVLELPPLTASSCDLYLLFLVGDATVVTRAAVDFSYFFCDVQGGYGKNARCYYPEEHDEQ